jgi:hypothetical protein
LGHASTASTRIICDSKQEEAHEKVDRAWRRWSGFCEHIQLGADLFLTTLSPAESELVARAFLVFYRDAEFSPDGRSQGQRRKPMVSGTLRDATSSLAATFRNNMERSPFHIKDGSVLLPAIKQLLKAYELLDPPKHRQKALTAKFLKKFFSGTAAGTTGFCDTAPAIAADLTIAAWFFAMRGCEFTKSPRQGKTKTICIHDIVFRDKHRRVIPLDSGRIHQAEFVTITFRDQKNGKKWDSRTQRRTGHAILCPVLRWASTVNRLLTWGLPLSTPVYHMKSAGNKVTTITTGYLKDVLRTTCKLFGGKQEFGFEPSEIGSKSIRSGAAMALFLADVSVAKIMILGRWNSDAFLDYIRPQVLEWTSSMSRDMTRTDDFIDVGLTRTHLPSDPRLRQQLTHFNGSAFVIPKFHLHH